MATFFYGKCRIEAEKSQWVPPRCSVMLKIPWLVQNRTVLSILCRHEQQSWKLHGCRGRQVAFVFNYLQQKQSFDRLDTTCEAKQDPRCHHVPDVPGLVTWQNFEALPSSQGWGTAQLQSPVLLWHSQLHCCFCFERNRACRSEDHWGKMLAPLHY